MTPTQLYNDPSQINWQLPIVIDFETYYDKEYSLSKITTEKYIRCDKFECIGVAVKIGNNPTYFYPKETGIEIIRHIVTTTYPNSPVAMQNCPFDGGILAFRYGIHPNFIVDTMTLAKLSAFDRVAGGTSLAKMSAQLEKMGIFNQVKGNEVHNMLGVHADDMTPKQWQAYGDYCKLDVDLTHALYTYLIDKVPTSELIMADITLRMWIDPLFDLDVPLLQDYAIKLEDRKQELLSQISSRLGFTNDELLKNLRSSKKFVAILERLGVEVPTKWSEKQEKMIPAVSKTDAEFLALLEHDNELVRTLVETKLGTMSSLSQTRTENFLEIASRGLFPVALRYASAHTGRYGGMDKINCFSAGHELLTPDGWVFVEDYQEGTPIMQWHADGTLSFDNNPAWLVKPYKGIMYAVDAPLIACKVTPDHRFSYVRHGDLKCGLVTKTIKQVYNSCKMDAIPVRGYVNTPDADISDDEIRYLVALQADGSVLDTKTCTRHIFGFRRVRKINRMELLLTNLGYEYSMFVSGNTTVFRVAPIGRCAVVDKNFGKWLLPLSVRQLTIFCDELLLWDGNKNSNNGSMEYNSTNRDNVLWVDTAMRLCGRHGSVYNYDYNKRRNPTHSSCWRLYERTTTYGTIVTKSHIKQVEYDGLVYCPKVDSDMILVRYGTKIFVTNQCQNLPKRTGDTTLRKSMRAKDGYVVVATDSTQVELRINSYMADQQDAIDVFTSGRDPYVDMASTIFNKPYDDIYHEAKVVGSQEGKRMRNLGKEVCLAGGYGMSANTFRNRMTLAGQMEAADMADDLIQAYRTKNYKIVQFWRECDRVLKIMHAGGSCWFGGPNNDLFFADGSSEFHGKKIPSIRFPNGTYLFYQNLRVEAGDNGREQFVYDQFKGRNWLPNRVWGSLCDENICQKLSFDILKWQAIEIAKRGVSINLNVHDEWVSVVPREQATYAVATHYECMRSTPDYIPKGLLDCEVDIGLSYGITKTVNVSKFIGVTI